MLSWLNDFTGLSITISSGEDKHERDSLQGTDPDSGIVWMEAELESEEQVGWLNAVFIEQGLTLYEVKRKKSVWRNGLWMRYPD